MTDACPRLLTITSREPQRRSRHSAIDERSRCGDSGKGHLSVLDDELGPLDAAPLVDLCIILVRADGYRGDIVVDGRRCASLVRSDGVGHSSCCPAKAEQDGQDEGEELYHGSWDVYGEQKVRSRTSAYSIPSSFI